MALGPRLDLRQSQQLVMTPQLQQAIKLLALSNLEIESFIGEALETNPLLEWDNGITSGPAAASDNARDEGDPAGEWPADTASGSHDRPLDSGADTVGTLASAADAPPEAHFDSAPTMGDGEAPDIESHGETGQSLTAFLEAQLGPATSDAQEALIARHIIGQLDEAGYLTATLRDIANELGAPLAAVEAALHVVQSLDPTGVGARGVGECLALQAREADRYDPCMARLIEHLDLIAKGDLKRLKRICDVDDEDLADMLAELRGYDPKPGLRFGQSMVGAPVTPDILVRPGGDGWDITLNPATLPRLLVNRDYYIALRGRCEGKAARGWLNEKLTDANWLVKALDQRQKTILKVAGEIVRRQEGFFRSGVSALKPLTLREVAAAIAMHESTVSRVTANKYLHCGRGTFELKYFFTSGVASVDESDAVSAEVVKAQIRTLIDAEEPASVLSDDALVEKLQAMGYHLARRTVAKYREAMGIGSSVQRRRRKKLESAV